MEADRQPREARPQVERERPVVVVLGVDVRALGTVSPQPAQSVVEQRLSQAPALGVRRDRQPLDVPRGGGAPEESVPARVVPRCDPQV